MALVRCALLNTTWMMPRTCGNIRPEHMPCTTRATIRVTALGAAPHTAEAAVKPSMPHRNMRLRPYVSPSRPPVTSTHANASM